MYVYKSVEVKAREFIMNIGEMGEERWREKSNEIGGRNFFYRKIILTCSKSYLKRISLFILQTTQY